MPDTLDMQDGKNCCLNIFRCEAPTAMIQAERAVVHGETTSEKARDFYDSLKSMEERSQYAK